MIDLVDAVISRLRDLVPALVSVEGCLDFASMVEKGVLPPATPVAFVLWSTLTAGVNKVLGGGHSQPLTERISVVVVVRAGNDARGDGKRQVMTPLRGGLIQALAGWRPVTGCGPFNFVAARLIGVANGAAFFDFSFQTTWELTNG